MHNVIILTFYNFIFGSVI